MSTTKLRAQLLASATILLFLAGCSDSTILESGAGAGDTVPDPEAVALVTPFVGIYNLPDSWSGSPPDEAFLEIQSPNEAGVAIALLHDWDDIASCLPARPSEGIVYKEEFGSRIFMDNILELSQSVLTQQGNTLIIEFQDESDLDNDPTTNRLTLNAPRLGVMTVNDLGESC